MDEPRVVRGFQSVENLHEQPSGVGDAQGASPFLLDRLVEAFSRNVFEDHEIDVVVAADVDGSGEIGVVDPPR